MNDYTSCAQHSAVISFGVYMSMVCLPAVGHAFELTCVTTVEFRAHPSVLRNPCRCLSSCALFAAIKV